VPRVRTENTTEALPFPGQDLRTRAVNGVSDGARTRDTQDHNLVLYLLSYAHHRRRAGPGPRSIAVTADGNDRSYFACGAFP
jgi:hypothetical protein